MTTHETRVALLKEALEKCHKNGWTANTPAIADRVATFFKGLGYTPATVKGLIYSTVDLLLQEKKTGKPALSDS